jgi:D-alanyl-D-alanine carboxypeptidase (penicillin-binding protein 5/6)
LFKKVTAFAVMFFALSLAFHARGLSAKAYAVVDQVSGRLLCGQNTDMRLPMASTTKIMTGLIACESGKLDSVVTVPPDALRVEGSSVGLLPGERLTLRELVYGLLLESGNDAANAVALELGGSITGFADKMNARAQQLGLTNTHFMNPSGLDADGHYTTACDLARLGADAMKNADFAKIAGTKTIKISYNGRQNGRTLVNHNRLLGSVDGITGIKTGHTKKCGRSLVSSATRGGISLVIATLNDPDDWNDHKQLFDSEFKVLKNHTLLTGPLDISAKVVGGLCDTIQADYDKNISAALTDSESGGVTMEIDIPDFIYAPVKQGQIIGKLVFKVNGQTVAQTDLKASKGTPAVRFRAKGAKGGSGVASMMIVILAVAAGAFWGIKRFYGKGTNIKLVRKLKEK